MKLRRAVRAIDGFGYQVEILDLGPKGSITKTEADIMIQDTNMRMGEHDNQHEVFIANHWSPLRKIEFDDIISSHKKKKVVLRRGNEVIR